MKLRFVVMLVLFLGLVAMAIITSGARIVTYVNIPSIIMVVVGAFVLTLFSHTPAETGRMFAAPFARAADPVRLRDASAFFDAFRRSLHLMGIIGFFTGVIAMLANLVDVTALGWGFALSLNTIWTALIADSVIVSPIQAAAKRRLILVAEGGK